MCLKLLKISIFNIQMCVMCYQLSCIMLHVIQTVLGRNTSCVGRNAISSTAYNTKISSESYSMKLKFERHIDLVARRAVVGVAIRPWNYKTFSYLTQLSMKFQLLTKMLSTFRCCLYIVEHTILLNKITCFIQLRYLSYSMA